jgi:hypothetical protein
MDNPASAEAGFVNLSVSILGDFTDTNDSEPFRYYEPPTVTSIYPHYGPKDGETLVQVWGTNFLNYGEYLRCNFGSRSVQAHFYNSNYITCRSPQSDTVGLAIPFSISQNLQQSSREPNNFFYYSRPIISKLTPNYGPATGGNEIEVLGAAFDPFSELSPHFRELVETSPTAIQDISTLQEANRLNKNDTFCIFDGVGKTKAKIISSTMAICPVPPSTKDSAEVYITLNNQQYSDDEILYYWYKAAKIYQISPKYGPTEGGTQVHMYGTGFQKGKQLLCVFDGIYVNATMINEQEITCVSPPHIVGPVKVQTTVYGDFGKSMSEPV